MTEAQSEAEKMLLVAESDMEALGWDKPTTLYGVAGTIEEPYLIKVAEFTDHPCVVLQEMFDDGIRVPDDAIALAISFEAWRHLTYEEMMERNPDAVEEIREKTLRMGKELGFKKITDDRLDDVMERSFDQVTTMVPPSSMPPNQRQELRSVMAVFKDGRNVTVVRDRGAEPKSAGEGEVMGRVPGFLHKFLLSKNPGDWDKEEHEDPADVIKKKRKKWKR